KGNTPSSKLAAQIRPLLPSTAQVRTVSAQVKQETKNVGFVGIIQKILLGFGGVALFVGAFVIFNTISITVAQRMRELATLRTIGASRRQVMASVLAEALTIVLLASVLGPPFKALVAAAGIGLLLYGFFVHGIGVTQRLLAMGVGAFLLFIGVALISAWLVRPFASVLGWPATKIGGSAGRLARANSIRNPGRTASTAAALMIGIALVTSVAVLASGIRNTIHHTLSRTFIGDYAVTSPDGFTPFTPASEKALARVPGVTAVSGERVGDGKAFGKTVQVSGVNADVAKVIHIDWTQGSNATP